RQRLAAVPARELRGPLERTVRDEGDRRAAGDEAPRRELRGPAGADEEDAATGEVAEDLLRECRGRRRHRDRVLADRGLRPDALACVERLPEEPVQERPGRAGLVG